MALQGDLASVDLAQIFQMLALSQKAGLLVVEAADDGKALYFDSRGVTLYYNEHTLLDRVLARMVRTGMLAPSIEQQARHHASSTGTSVADALLAGACFTEDQLEAGYRSEMEEEIYGFLDTRAGGPHWIPPAAAGVNALHWAFRNTIRSSAYQNNYDIRDLRRVSWLTPFYRRLLRLGWIGRDSPFRGG